MSSTFFLLEIWGPYLFLPFTEVLSYATLCSAYSAEAAMGAKAARLLRRVN